MLGEPLESILAAIGAATLLSAFALACIGWRLASKEKRWRK